MTEGGRTGDSLPPREGVLKTLYRVLRGLIRDLYTPTTSVPKEYVVGRFL